MEKNNNNPVEQAEPVFSTTTSAFSGIFRAIGSSLIVRGIIMILFGLLFWIHPVQVMNIIIIVIGIMLIIIAIVKPFRESLCRIFAI